MLAPPIGLEFQEPRAAASPGVFHRMSGQRVHLVHVVAVARRGLASVAARHRQSVARGGLAHGHRRIHRISVVLADKHNRQLAQRREVDALEEHALFGGGLAEKHRRHTVALLLGRGKRHTDGHRKASAHNRRAAEHIHAEINQVHRPALAAGAPGRLAVYLGEHCFEVTALGQVVGMAAMRAERVVARLQRGAGADRRRFLPDAEVDRAAHFLLAVPRGNCFFDGADPHQLPQGCPFVCESRG